jgi:peptide-methionine (S)-S-oxide reductase
VSTRVGYTGGKSENPTYGTVCGGDGHTEALKVEFDPRVVSYDDLLNCFWEEHNPSGYKPKVQYKSAIWPTSESQREIAIASRDAIESKYGSVHTDIEDEQQWWDAEEYHQKYFDKMSGRQWM